MSFCPDSDSDVSTEGDDDSEEMCYVKPEVSSTLDAASANLLAFKSTFRHLVRSRRQTQPLYSLGTNLVPPSS